MLYIPVQYDPHGRNRTSTDRRVMLELRGNPFPPLNYSNIEHNKNHLHNVLLHEAKKEFYANGGFGAQLTDDSSSSINVAEELECVDEVDVEKEKE